MPTIPSDRPGSEVRDLSGTVSNGDDLPSAINSVLDDGVQVYVPPGEYTGRHSDLNFSADNATIYGDPKGVSIKCEMDSNATMSTGGTLRIENIDIRGKKPKEQVKLNVEPSGGRLEWINFNFPDGTTSPSDSYVARCDSGTGHHFLQNCYIGPHGNSAFYYSERNTQEMDVTFKGCAFHNCANPIRGGNMTVENCIYLADGTVPDFIDIEAGGEVDEGTPRMFKFEGGGNTVVRNCDVMITSEAGPADGPCVDWGGDATDSNTVEIHNSRFANKMGREAFDTASAPEAAVSGSKLDNVSVTTEPVFSGPKIPGGTTSSETPRTDIESRRWNPLSGQSGDSGQQGSDGGGSFGLPGSFEVITGSEATPPNTDSTIWTPVDGATAPEDPSGDGSGSSDGSGESGTDGGDTGSSDGDSGSTDGGSDSDGGTGSTDGSTDSNDDGSGSTDGSTGSGDGSSGSTDDGSGGGGSGSDGGSRPGKILVVDGTGDADELARYEVAVTGELTRDEQRSEVVDGGLPWDGMVDYVSDGRVAGVIGNGRDAYRFTGEITAIDVSGHADFKLLRE